jgi:hypothetical protein
MSQTRIRRPPVGLPVFERVQHLEMVAGGDQPDRVVH